MTQLNERMNERMNDIPGDNATACAPSVAVVMGTSVSCTTYAGRIIDVVDDDDNDNDDDDDVENRY
jgi:hypothetical protein